MREGTKRRASAASSAVRSLATCSFEFGVGGLGFRFSGSVMKPPNPNPNELRTHCTDCAVLLRVCGAQGRKSQASRVKFEVLGFGTHVHCLCFRGLHLNTDSSGENTQRPTSLLSKFGTHKPVKARFWPWLEPCSARKSLTPFKLLPPHSPAGQRCWMWEDTPSHQGELPLAAWVAKAPTTPNPKSNARQQEL